MKYSDIYSFENLYDAYIKARKQKRYRQEVLIFSYYLDQNLILLQKEIEERTYKVGEYRTFTVREPKLRKIVALPFRDRIVQHAINTIIEPAFEKRMIYDSYACRAGKGTHAAAKRVSYFLGKPSNRYYLKCDVKSFFASIDREILKAVIKRYIDDRDILDLLNTIFDSSPVPGLPVGNLMSQLFANVYLHELDHHCKNVLGIKYYVRYMDDIIVMSDNKAYLKEVLNDITEFIGRQLKLSFNNKTTINNCLNGVEFVGYRIWKGYKLLKKQTLARMRKRLRAWKTGKITNEAFVKSVSSWAGHSFGTSSHKSVEQIMLKAMLEMQRRLDNGLQGIAEGDTDAAGRSG